MEWKAGDRRILVSCPRICLPRIYPPFCGQHHTAFFGEHLTHTPAFNLFMQRWPSDGHVLDSRWAAKEGTVTCGHNGRFKKELPTQVQRGIIPGLLLKLCGKRDSVCWGCHTGRNMNCELLLAKRSAQGALA